MTLQAKRILTAITLAAAAAATGCTDRLTMFNGQSAGEWKNITATVTKDVWADKPGPRLTHRFIEKTYERAVTDTLSVLGVTHHQITLANPRNMNMTGKPEDQTVTIMFQIAGEQYDCPPLPDNTTQLSTHECTITIGLGGLEAYEDGWRLSTSDQYSHSIRVLTRENNLTLERAFYKKLNEQLPDWTTVETNNR